MPEDKQRDLFDGLLWYLKVRNWAFEKIKTCPHGSEEFDIRMHHAVYFTNLMSAVCHVCDHLENDESTCSAFTTQIENGLGGPQTYEYVRELRNAVVHRGFDPILTILGDGPRLIALCPETVPGRKRKIYPRPSAFKYTVELGAHCNAATNTAIAGVLDRLDLFNPARLIIDEDDVCAAVASSPAPDWAKDAAEKFLRENYAAVAAELAATRVRDMRGLLGLDGEHGP